jgi:hypothetical protein
MCELWNWKERVPVCTVLRSETNTLTEFRFIDMRNTSGACKCRIQSYGRLLENITSVPEFVTEFGGSFLALKNVSGKFLRTMKIYGRTRAGNIAKSCIKWCFTFQPALPFSQFTHVPLFGNYLSRVLRSGSLGAHEEMARVRSGVRTDSGGGGRRCWEARYVAAQPCPPGSQ